MKTKAIFATLLATAALSFTVAASAHAPGETVTPNFSHAIPNIPGKSLVAVEVLYPPGPPRNRIPTRSRLSSTRTSYRARSKARSTMDLLASTRRASRSTKRLAPITG